LIFISISVYAKQEVTNNPKAEMEWWRETYGSVSSAENPKVTICRSVFRDLWNAVQPISIQRPSILVIPKNSEKWVDSWALATADGSIVLVESILDLTLGKSDPLETTAISQLAFILAHELAHIVNQHHQKAGFGVLFQKTSRDENSEKGQPVELDADEYGLFLMTKAGYDPNTILTDHGINFFVEYEKKVHEHIETVKPVNDHLKHPQIMGRAFELRARLVNFSKKLQHFNLGIKAYFRGNYKVAVQQFTIFSKYFASREVENNIGVSYLQQARKMVLGCDAEKYQTALAIKLDVNNRAEKLRRKEEEIRIGAKEILKCETGKRFQHLTNKAKIHLELSALKGPKYWLAFSNLSALWILKGDAQAAKFQATEALRNHPNNDFALVNLAMANYLDAPSKNKSFSIKLLKSVSEDSEVSLEKQLNLENILLNGHNSSTPEALSAPVILKKQ